MLDHSGREGQAMVSDPTNLDRRKKRQELRRFLVAAE
jgi:hypothetical protein